MPGLLITIEYKPYTWHQKISIKRKEVSPLLN
nr:MAG TPA: hypothetical protein [Caudoviricetes sp.]